MADFGLTSEGTSQNLVHTEFSRGTPGYRAPELLQDDAKYNNKVDIWSMGCILYELVVGTKLFATDLAILEHYRSKSSLDIAFDETFDATSQTDLLETIHITMQSNPSLRLTAETLANLFSIKRVITKVQSVKQLEKFANDSVTETRREAGGSLPILRKMPPPERLHVAGYEVTDQHEWTIIFTLVNVNSTKLAKNLSSTTVLGRE